MRATRRRDAPPKRVPRQFGWLRFARRCASAQGGYDEHRCNIMGSFLMPMKLQPAVLVP
jgi:hypothetical protein